MKFMVEKLLHERKTDENDLDQYLSSWQGGNLIRNPTNEEDLPMLVPPCAMGESPKSPSDRFAKDTVSSAVCQSIKENQERRRHIREKAQRTCLHPPQTTTLKALRSLSANDGVPDWNDHNSENMQLEEITNQQSNRRFSNPCGIRIHHDMAGSKKIVAENDNRPRATSCPKTFQEWVEAKEKLERERSVLEKSRKRHEALEKELYEKEKRALGKSFNQWLEEKGKERQLNLQKQQEVREQLKRQEEQTTLRKHLAEIEFETWLQGKFEKEMKEEEHRLSVEQNKHRKMNLSYIRQDRTDRSLPQCSGSSFKKKANHSGGKVPLRL